MTLPIETPRSANRQIWSLQTVLATDPAALAQQLAVEPNVTLLVDNDAPLPNLVTGLTRVVDAGGQATVRIQRADRELLTTLAQGRAASVEWAVRAPTSGASRAWSGGTEESDGLRTAIALAAACGLTVRLRWRIAARSVPALAELAELSGLAPSVTVIALPWLDASEAPALDAVILAWPKDLPTDVVLLRSGLWPSCLAGLNVEPPTSGERAQAAARHVDICASCPVGARPDHPQGCTGVPAAILDRPGGPGPDWRGWLRLPGTQQHDDVARIDPNCVEARGLVLGLRRAWRLFLRQSDVPEYRRAFAERGWHVVSAASVDAGIGGAIRADGDGIHVLTVVAVTAEDAAACLRAELANLQRPPSPVTDELRERWRDIAEAHRQLGALYGYPACCVEAFLDAHAEIVEQVRHTDNAINILRATLRTRHFDARLTSIPGLLGEEAPTPLRHLPCRFDCPDSQALVKVLLADLAVHNPIWSARQQAQDAEPIILFADGSCISLQARAIAHDVVTDFRGITVRPSQMATEDFAEQLMSLAQMPDLEAIRVEPGLGLALLRSGHWHEWRVPPQAVPRAAEFPILLPFTLDPA